MLSKDYYDRAIGKMKALKHDIKFLVITDDIPLGHEFFPYYPVINNSKETDFTLLNKARYLIIANSSFSWWAAWLNQDNYVIAPQGWLNVSTKNEVFVPRNIKVERFNWV